MSACWKMLYMYVFCINIYIWITGSHNTGCHMMYLMLQVCQTCEVQDAQGDTVHQESQVHANGKHAQARL